MPLTPHYLGGDTSHRGIFGGSSPRRTGLLIWFAAFSFLTLFLQLAGFAVSIVLLSFILVATIPRGRQTLWQEWLEQRAWKKRIRAGMTVYRPISRRPKGVHLTPVEDAAFRDWPEGADGMNWLQSSKGRPGIAWHTPVDEPPYLQVTWRVEGSIAGLRSDDYVNLASTAFGALLAETARPMSLIDSIQTVTQAARIDMTEHEIWLIQNAAEDAPGILFESYGQLIGMMERSAMGQEHHIVVRWPLSSEFLERASHLGPQHAGWLELMNAEIAKVTRRLNRSKLGSARPLTARELTAVIRHMQMPSWPRGDLSGIDPDEIGLPYDEGARSYVVTEDLNPQGEVEQWLHRTAEVTAKRLESEQFDALWLMPILSALPEQIQRTVSTHITTRPAGAARRDARYDLTLDTAEMREQRRKGQILDDTLNAEHKAAQVRHMDLRPNTGIQGAGWAMHITISARSLPELRKARDIITQGCSDAGIASLDWLDSHHGAAMSWTWPIGRGMTMYKPTATARMLSTLSARDQGDSL